MNTGGAVGGLMTSNSKNFTPKPDVHNSGKLTEDNPLH